MSNYFDHLSTKFYCGSVFFANEMYLRETVNTRVGHTNHNVTLWHLNASGVVILTDVDISANTNCMNNAPVTLATIRSSHVVTQTQIYATQWIYRLRLVEPPLKVNKRRPARDWRLIRCLCQRLRRHIVTNSFGGPPRVEIVTRSSLRNGQQRRRPSKFTSVDDGGRTNL